MRWYRAILYVSVQVGTDETCNPVCEIIPTGDYVLVRTAPWTRSHVSTEGNQFDMVSRTFLTKSPSSKLEGVSEIEVAGVAYKVEGVSHDGRETVIKVGRCDKSWGSG